jgi:hypothetical protein
MAGDDERRRKDHANRRFAIQLAGQLPESREDALAVVTYMRELVEDYLAPTGETDRSSRLSVVRPLREPH